MARPALALKRKPLRDLLEIGTLLPRAPVDSPGFAEFERLLATELADAHARATETFGLKRGYRSLRSERRCGACGCPHDERTRGCRPCSARHGARRKAAERNCVVANRPVG